MFKTLVNVCKTLVSKGLEWLEQQVQKWTQPAQPSLILETVGDVTRDRPELILENALLRQQVIVLKRSVKRPKLTNTGRRWLVVLASRIKAWQSALLLVKPETLLQWHRQLFKLVWRRKSARRVAQQLREATPFGQGPTYLIRDNDSKYGQAFARVAAGAGIQVLKTPIAAPNANAMCERFLESVRYDCLDHLLVLIQRHLLRMVQAYVTYFNRQRPYQGIEQRIPDPLTSPPVDTSQRPIITAQPILGGLHTVYQRAA